MYTHTHTHTHTHTLLNPYTCMLLCVTDNVHVCYIQITDMNKSSNRYMYKHFEFEADKLYLKQKKFQFGGAKINLRREK